LNVQNTVGEGSHKVFCTFDFYEVNIQYEISCWK